MHSLLFPHKTGRAFPSLMNGVDVSSTAGVCSIPLPAELELELAPKKGLRLAPSRPLPEFIADDANPLAAALLTVLDRHRAACTPLVLYGPTGCGKTVLALALVKKYIEADPRLRVGLEPASPQLLPRGEGIRALTAADFARAYAHAVETDSITDFRDRFLAPLVLIDDVQHLADKEAAQHELRLLLDLLAKRGTPVIITSRLSPQELPFVADLRGRLAGGMVIPLHWPGEAARREIATRYLTARNHGDVSPAIIERIAITFSGSPARLFAALAELVHLAETDRRAIDDSLLDELTAEQREQSQYSPRAIIAAVAKQFRVTVKALKGTSRRQAINTARGVAMYLLRERTGETFEQIGRQFSGRDHTTVMHACQKTVERLAEDPQLAREVEQIIAQLEAAP
jgi:chromosomal replication initiator protein